MPFRIPGNNIQALYTSTRLRLVSVSPMQLPWTGWPPIVVTFQPDRDDTTPAVGVLPGIDLHLGRCTISELASGRTGSERHLGPHWARLVFHGVPGHEVLGGTTDREHSCAEDHICNWPENTKVFRPPQSQPTSGIAAALPSESESLVLWFTRCPLNPNTTLVVNIIAGESR